MITLSVDKSNKNLIQITEIERQTLLEMIEHNSGLDTTRIAIHLLCQDDIITDEKIAEDLNTKLDEVRRALYILHDLEVASHRRTKDPKSSWYIYSWKIHPKNIHRVLREGRKKVFSKIKERLDYEKKSMFFYCKGKNCENISIEAAMEIDFECNKCEGQLFALDNSKIIAVLDKKLKEVEPTLSQGLNE